jgi:hypothetical protein
MKSIRVGDETHRWLRIEAAKAGVSLVAFVTTRLTAGCPEGLSDSEGKETRVARTRPEKASIENPVRVGAVTSQTDQSPATSEPLRGPGGPDSGPHASPQKSGEPASERVTVAACATCSAPLPGDVPCPTCLERVDPVGTGDAGITAPAGVGGGEPSRIGFESTTRPSSERGKMEQVPRSAFLSAMPSTRGACPDCRRELDYPMRYSNEHARACGRWKA